VNKDQLSQGEIAYSLEEANILEKLSNPNIVRFKRVFVHHYIAIEMELLRGGHLKRLLRKRNKFSEPEVVTIARGLFTGIAHFHSLNYMHRDLKPANVLLRSEDDLSSVKIVDFGLSEIYRGDKFQ
jgi:serine/threonine protein kinase